MNKTAIRCNRSFLAMLDLIVSLLPGWIDQAVHLLEADRKCHIYIVLHQKGCQLNRKVVHAN
jgi:hypothetical protein